MIATHERELAELLLLIAEHDTDYDARYWMVFRAIDLALALGYRAGVRLDPDEPAWPAAYIELPTGQVSWHLPQHPFDWDGHDTAEKYRRCRAYAEGGR